MTTEAVYVALDAPIFEARFRAYPPVAHDADVERLVAASWRAELTGIAYDDDAACWLRDDVLAPDPAGGRRLDGPRGWPLVMAEALDAAERARWQAGYPRSLLHLWGDDGLAEELGEPWRRLGMTLFQPAPPEDLPWWVRRFREDGSFYVGLTAPAGRDALLAELAVTETVPRAARLLREAGSGRLADDLEGLVAFLGSEAAAGRWLLAWIAPT